MEKSFLQKWDEHVAKWKNLPEAQGRNLEIELEAKKSEIPPTSFTSPFSKGRDNSPFFKGGGRRPGD